MPELPEVETVANGVNERVRGQRIESVWFGSKPEPFRTPASLMAEQLPGRHIDRVRRVGKHIVFDLGSNNVGSLKEQSAKVGRRSPATPRPQQEFQPGEEPDAQWLVHLGMTGRLLVCDPETPLPAHTHAVLRLSAGNELRFVDARRFGRLALLLRPAEAEAESARADENHAGAAAKKALSAPGKESAGREVKKRALAKKHPTKGTDSSVDGAFGFKGPGSEPLTINPAEFAALFRGRKLSIKSALLNQKLLHGVGNIYADESLFRAGIRPRRLAGRLTRAQLLRLHTALVQVLLNAIELGGSSVSDYVDADGVKGFFQLEHRVYQRTGQPCLVCATPIRRVVLGGRSTHYCPTCQR